MDDFSVMTVAVGGFHHRPRSRGEDAPSNPIRVSSTRERTSGGCCDDDARDDKYDFRLPHSH